MTLPIAAEAVGGLAGAGAEGGAASSGVAVRSAARSRSVTQRTGVTPSRPKPPAGAKPPAAGTEPPASKSTSSGRRTIILPRPGGSRGRSGGRGGGGAGGGRSGKGSGAHRMVIAEFILCVILIGMSPILTRPPGSSGHLYVANDFLRLTGVCLLFFILALLSNQPTSARFAAAFGGLVTLGAVVNANKAILAIATLFAPKGGAS